MNLDLYIRTLRTDFILNERRITGNDNNLPKVILEEFENLKCIGM